MVTAMKTAGIIVEYNPFHNGHRYHMEKTRDITGCDYLVAIMSGNYTQRGVPAFADKYLRAKMALLNGADLVLELPLYYAAGSAEYFSMGAVSLLDKLGVIDSLCFGSECGDIHILTEIASVLLEEPGPYRNSLQEGLKKGLSYPKARSLALTACLPSFYADAVSSPNNILGMEYIKAIHKIKSSIQPYTIRRAGAGYHDELLFDSISDNMPPKSSATAIRRSISSSDGLLPIEEHVPGTVYELLKTFHLKSFPVRSGDFSLLLKYKLLMEEKEGYTKYVDIHSDLSDKIRKNLHRYKNFEQFCELLKTKNMTYSRISRCLLHILLDMKKEEFNHYIINDYIYYARILGFRRESAGLLHQIRTHAHIPLISKLADASSLLDETGYSMLQKDIYASNLYDSVISDKFNTEFVNEYSKQLVIL